MIGVDFRPLRLVQASYLALTLLKKSSYDFTKVAHILDLADCRCILDTGHEMTGYKCGSEVAAHLRKALADNKFLRLNGEMVEVLSHPGDSELSDYDVELLTDICSGRVM